MLSSTFSIEIDVTTEVLITLLSILQCTGSTWTHLFDNISTVTISSCPAIKVELLSVKFTFCLVSSSA